MNVQVTAVGPDARNGRYAMVSGADESLRTVQKAHSGWSRFAMQAAEAWRMAVDHVASAALS